jgi:hypothetical protein
MPHDMNGCNLVIGDVVTLQARVLGLYNSENDECNINLQILGNSSYKPLLTCNSKLVTYFVGDRVELDANVPV